MPTLRISNKTLDLLAADEILETLLVEARAAGELPTDENRLLSFLGLEQMSFDFTHELDFLSGSDKPRGEVRAAVHLAERVVATQAGMGEKRTRFCIFHEIAHCVLPEHNDRLFIDSDQTLSWWTKARLEREANQFAANLLFQGGLFTDRALDGAVSLKTAITLAPQFGASFEAAFRRYCETHICPCALVVYDKTAPAEESYIEEDNYRLQYVITSAPFRKAYFSSLQTSEETATGSDILGLNASWNIGTIVEKELRVNGQGEQTWLFETELFNNGYKIFQFLKRPLKAT
jgi:Zn-dependent peptidase ImmA (M78 family)